MLRFIEDENRGVLLVGMCLSLCYSGFADTVTIPFSGWSYLTTAAAGPGIYGVNSVSESSPVWVSITIDADVFIPNGGYLPTSAGYWGGEGSSTVTVSDAYGTKTFYGTSSNIEMCSICTVQWTFENYNSTTYANVEFQAFSRTISVSPASSLFFSPLDHRLTSGDYFSAMISDGDDLLVFSWAPTPAAAPEPRTAGIALVGLLAGLSWLRIKRQFSVSRPSAPDHTAEGMSFRH